MATVREPEWLGSCLPAPKEFVCGNCICNDHGWCEETGTFADEDDRCCPHFCYYWGF